MRLNMTTINKSAAAREATARGDKFFTATCARHGETEHYASTRACVVCQAKRNAPKNAAAAERYRSDPEFRGRWRERTNVARRKRRADPDYRAAENAQSRAQEAARKTRDPEYVAHRRAMAVNGSAISRMRKAGRPETALPSPEMRAECYAFVRRAPEGSEFDHGVPLIGIHPVTGEETVCGLHVPYNLEPMTRRSNTIKRHYFDPEHPLEFQKPYNSYPGGQFHGDIGEIEFMRYTQPTTLELMTVTEWRQAVVDAGNEDMTEWAAQWDDRQ
jgi:hypothetical protein